MKSCSGRETPIQLLSIQSPFFFPKMQKKICYLIFLISDCTAPFTVDIFFNKVPDKANDATMANSKQSKGIFSIFHCKPRSILFLIFNFFRTLPGVPTDPVLRLPDAADPWSRRPEHLFYFILGDVKKSSVCSIYIYIGIKYEHSSKAKKKYSVIEQIF